jgi:hypothetical protein
MSQYMVVQLLNRMSDVQSVDRYEHTCSESAHRYNVFSNLEYMPNLMSVGTLCARNHMGKTHAVVIVRCNRVASYMDTIMKQ